MTVVVSLELFGYLRKYATVHMSSRSEIFRCGNETVHGHGPTARLTF